MYPPPMPLITDVSADKLARTIREAREVGLVDGPEFATYIAERIFPHDPRRAAQFVNLADPAAQRAA